MTFDYEHWKRIFAGDRRLSTESVNPANDLLEQLRLVTADGNGDSRQGAIVSALPVPDFLARITGVSVQSGPSASAYNWLAVSPTFAEPGQFLYQDDPAFGRDDYPAYERDSRLDVPVDGTAVVWMRDGGGFFFVFSHTDEPVWAKITGAPSGASYPWAQVYRSAAGSWTELPGGLEGTTMQNPATELYNNAFVPENVVVELRRGHCTGYPYVWVQYQQYGDTISNPTIQQLSVLNAVGGTYSLTVFSADGTTSQTTGAIAYNAGATAIQLALNAILPTLGFGITVGGGPPPAAYTLTYTDGGQYLGYPLVQANYQGTLLNDQEWLFAWVAGSSSPGQPPCVDIETVVDTELRCDYPNLNEYTRTLTYLCGVLQFPLPGFTLTGTVGGCCVCSGTPPTGSGAPLGCCPSTAATYFCVCFPFAGCGAAVSGITLVRDGLACLWDNAHGGGATTVTCISAKYLLYFTGCDSDLCGDSVLTLTVYQSIGGVPTGQAVYQVLKKAWDCNSPWTLTLVYNNMTGPDDLGITITKNVTVFPGNAPCCWSASGPPISASGPAPPLSGPPFWCIELGSAGGVPSECCAAGPVPSTITATYTGALPYGPLTLVYDGGAWSATVTACEYVNSLVSLTCTGGTWIFGGAGVSPAPVTVTSCSPTFAGTLSGTTDSTSCPGAFTVTLSGTGGAGSGSPTYVCISEDQILAGNIAIGEPVVWIGGNGTIVAGPYASANCGGNCSPPESGIPIDNPCCAPLPDVLHITFGGALTPLGSVKFVSQNPGSGTGPWEAIVNTPCGNGNMLVECTNQGAYGGNVWILEIDLLSPATGCQIAAECVAFTTSCAPLLVQFITTGGAGPLPAGTIRYSNCPPDFCQGDVMKATLTL